MIRFNFVSNAGPDKKLSFLLYDKKEKINESNLNDILKDIPEWMEK